MYLSELPYYMLRCLILTIIIECLIAFILKYRKKDLLNIAIINIITNPIVSSMPVYFNIKFGILGRDICLFVLELLVLIIEGFLFQKYLKKKRINSYLLSIILNTSSYSIGVLIDFIGV